MCLGGSYYSYIPYVADAAKYISIRLSLSSYYCDKRWSILSNWTLYGNKMKTVETIVLWLLSAVILMKPGLFDDTKTLYILTVQPYSSEVPSLMPSWSGGTRLFPAMYLAVEMINNRSDVLSGYSLDLINADGGCDFPNNARVSFVKKANCGRYCESSAPAVPPLV